jgi:serine/threonine protein kinase
MAIVGDVAEGMAYMHHYAPVRVVHCDLKRNVLLDDGLRAVISDFGIAKLVAGGVGEASSISDEAAPCNSITRLLQGSVGYIAPGTLRYADKCAHACDFCMLSYYPCLVANKFLIH